MNIGCRAAVPTRSQLLTFRLRNWRTLPLRTLVILPPDHGAHMIIVVVRVIPHVAEETVPILSPAQIRPRPSTKPTGIVALPVEVQPVLLVPPKTGEAVLDRSVFRKEKVGYVTLPLVTAWSQHGP